MSVKWINLFYLTCALMNVLHIYQICDQYFRYDVTTNIKIDFPEIVEFPSITLCTVLVSLLKWEKMSSDLRRSLLQVALPKLTNETLLSQMVSDPSLIHPDINIHEKAWDKLSYNIYSGLVKEVPISMIFNLTAWFDEIFPVISTSGLAYHSLGSDKQKTHEDRRTSGKFQFTIDSTFIHDRYKCWTLNIRPELNKIYFDELRAVYYYPRRFLTSWKAYVKSEIQVYLHSKGYLINTEDDKNIIGSKFHAITSFVSHESVRLEYPYKTNCRDYTKIGFTSRKHCKEMCFKSKTIQKYGAILEDTHAFQSDNMFFNQSEYPWTSPPTVLSFLAQCKTDCEEKDCRSVTYQTEVTKLPNKLKYSQQWLIPAHNVITFTETQPAMPLVSFLTELLATFGIWMGLSITSSLMFFRRTWTKVRSFRHEIKSRQRLTPPQPINERLNSITRWTTHMNVMFQQMYIRQRINTLHNIQSRVHNL